MAQKKLYRNLTGTVMALGCVISVMNPNSTMVIVGNDHIEMPTANYRYYSETSTNPFSLKIRNVYEKKTSTRLEDEVMDLFGEMRDATEEEEAGVAKYLNSIAIDTGVNLFDLC